jgi:sulfite reductase beta subunit-like hemoprotein
LILGGLALLVLAAGAYLQYTQELNKARLAIAAHVSGVQTLKAQMENPWLKFIRPAGWRDKLKSAPLRWYDIGNAAFAIGGVALTVVVGKLLI